MNKAKILLITAVVILVVLALIVAIVLMLRSSNSSSITTSSDDSNVDNNNSASKNCPDGKWIDTHVHLESDIALEESSVRMDEYNISCELAFIYIDPKDPLDSLEIFNEDYIGDTNRLIPFFFVTPKAAKDEDVKVVKNIRELTKDFFYGHGEVAFYRDPLRNSFLTDSNFDELFKYSEENSFFIMFHLRGSEQISDLEAILKKYPNAKALLHGPELYKELPDILEKYPNLYFTLDTASLLIQDGAPIELVNLMYSPGGKDTFIEQLNINRSKLLKDSYAKWFPLFEAAPTRIFWGTDVSSDWHFDKDVYNELMSFSEGFLKMLPEEYRAGYMYMNAKGALL